MMPKKYEVMINKLQTVTITVETDNPDDIGLWYFPEKEVREAFEDAESDMEIIQVEEIE